jgi:hypothetical protein
MSMLEVVRESGTERLEFGRTYSYFKYSDCEEQNPFGGIKSIDPAVEELESTHGDEIRASVPSNITDTFEVICDLGYCCSDDCSVLEGVSI